MNKKDFKDVTSARKKLESSWEVEIERLQHDIKKTQSRIDKSEHNNLIEKENFLRECKNTDSVDSLSNSVNFYSSHVAKNRIMPGDRKTNQRQRTSAAAGSYFQPENVRIGRAFDRGEPEWMSASRLLTSPVEAPKRRKIKVDGGGDPFAERSHPDSSFDLDCNSSVISLDFGLVSPKKMWSSPPQRIERAQNREWSSPHRIIDRPNPENSPGNWVTFKESRVQSLATVVSNTKEKADDFQATQPRSISQTTYVVPEKASAPVLPRNNRNVQTTRITSVLQEYDSEKKRVKKKMTGSSEQQLETTNEKVRRLVEPDGHVIKITLLEDYEVPSFGNWAEKVDASAEAEKLLEQSPTNFKPNVTTVKTKGGSLKTIVTSKLYPLKASKSKESRKLEVEEEKTNSRPEIRKNEDKMIAKENEFDYDKENKEIKDEERGITNSKQVIKDLEEILRGPIDFEADKHTGETERGKIKTKKVKLIKKHPQTAEEKPIMLPEKKKRYNDEEVQEFIKSQKQKRLEQMKTEKRFKVAEKEARKKKLEELRIKTLKLAAQSKKKKPPETVVETVEQGTEDDITMSLGLKQIKPKVSYNESISNLKKKITSMRDKFSKDVIETLSDEGGKSEKEQSENKESVQSEKESNETLKKPEDVIKTDIRPQNDINATLRRLAETLQEEIQEKKKQFRSKSSPSVFKEKVPRCIPSQESLKSVQTMPGSTRQTIAVDLDTIHSLKEDIKKISENFKVLHEIIVEKTDMIEEKLPVRQPEPAPKEEPKPPPPSFFEKEETVPLWLKNLLPKPHPYNICTAFKHKMNVNSSASMSSQEDSSPPQEATSKKSFKSLSTPIDCLASPKQVLRKISSQSSNRRSNTSGENYFTFKEDSGSEFSSSILDSDNRSLTSVEVKEGAFIFPTPGSSKLDNCDKGSMTSSVITEITRSVQLDTSKSSILSKNIISRLSNNQDMVLITPDIKLISNDLADKKVNNFANNINLLYKSMSTSSKNSTKPEGVEELNNSEGKSNKDQKSESVITEIIDNLSENEKTCKSLKFVNEKPQNSIQRLDDTQRRSFFQPEMLHLQFQAELTLLETFQQSLSRFLEVERLKTLSEVNKIVNEKAIKPEPVIQKEDQAVQTSFLKYEPQSTASHDVEKTETESVKTEISISEESIETEKIVSSKKNIEEEEEEKETSDISEKISMRFDDEDNKKEKMELPQIYHEKGDSFDLSNGQSGISFQMLDRMMKDEELRSEHQLALIRLREKTLNEKVKAELTFLEMKKKTFKERGDKEQNVSAIKKRQRGILMKYQSEKEEIERLKKMHKIASEERKIMITQQKQIQRMQLSTKDMITKLKKREKSPNKKSLRINAPHCDSESDMPEDIPEAMSDSLITESVRSLEDLSLRSNDSDVEISSRSNISENVVRDVQRNIKTLEKAVVTEADNQLNFKGIQLTKRHSVEELLNWTRRLEEKELKLQELERRTNAANAAKNKVTSTKKIATKDRSTSPFQFPETVKSISEVAPSISELLEPKKSSITSEVISESISQTVSTEKPESVPEKIHISLSEKIPEQFSKTINATASKTMEYNSESFESLSSSEATKMKSLTLRSKSIVLETSHKNMPIKLALSPKIQSSKRRYSSGSDDSLNFSFNETASEQSDLECRIAALHEQLRKRKLEAERLRREQKKVQREKLQVKEQSLLNQIKAYDAYIQKKKQELKQEYEYTSKIVVKPLIKQPKVDKKSNLKLSELLFNENAKTKEKEDIVLSEKIGESDSEIQEYIKEMSESIKEETKVSPESTQEDLQSVKDDSESKIEEEIYSKDSQTIPELKTSPGETSDTAKSNSLSELVCEQEENEGSQSESEDQSLSIKTTLQSPVEKHKSDLVESAIVTESIQSEKLEEKEEREEGISKRETLAEDGYQLASIESDKESPKRETLAEDEAYQFDSFESDVEEIQSAKSSDVQKQSDSKTICSEIETESLHQVEEKEEEHEEEEIISTEEKESSLTSVNINIVETPPNDIDKVERISDSILYDLIKESLDIFSVRKEEVQKKLEAESKLNLEALSSCLAREIIVEAVDDMLKIYNRKSVSTNEDETPISPHRVTSDIKKRIYEIISQGGERREGVVVSTSPQSVMITTFDVTPVESPTDDKENISESEERDEFLRSLNFISRKEDKVFQEAEANHEESKTENEGQEWMYDDLNLSRTNREAEELRLQQLQIEQEIQQLQAQQEQVPYFYLREIPNKPPPPYTPPGKLPTEIPTSQADITAVTQSAVQIFVDEMNKGKTLSDIKPNRDFYGKNVSNEHVKCYKLFLFDLARHIIEDLLRHQEKKEDVLPWTKCGERLSLFKYKNVERTLECLNGLVEKQVLTLFGFGKKVGKESLIDKWIRKKRDHVDEILVVESQEEESQWTDYDEDQVAVKNEVALAILDNLVEESAEIVNIIFNKKIKKIEKLVKYI